MRLVDVMKEKDMSGMPIALGDIQGLSEEEWLHWRDHGPSWKNPESPEYIPFTVGGSDSSSIMCASPWRTRLELFHQKSGIEKAAKKEENTAAKEAGHIYEPFVAEICRRQLKALPWVKALDFFNDTTMYRSGQRNSDGTLKYPWALADFDRVAVINGEPYIIELKTTSYRNVDTIKKWQSGIVPFYYETQVRHYMAVANVDHAAICCAWGFSKDDTALIFIDRDMDYEEEIMDAEGRFIDLLSCGIEPDTEDENQDLLAKYYAELYGPADDSLPPVELSQYYDKAVANIVKLQRQIELSEKNTDELKRCLHEACNQVLPAFISADGQRIASYASYNTEDGKHVGISISSSTKRASFDEKRFALEHPLEYKECLENKFSSTRLRLLDKKNKTRFRSEYMNPPEVSDKPENKFTVKISDAIDKK